jgi:hypothetical protein
MTSESEPRSALWRWATENGVPREGTEDELVQQLASGQLPGFALVWKMGWGEWLPAMQVAELAVALPFEPLSGRRTPRPSNVPGAVPPIPVSEYPRLRLLAKQSLRETRPSFLPPGGRAGQRGPQAAHYGVAVQFDGPEHEVITSQVPEDALLEAARAMTQPSPPLNLGLAAAMERVQEHGRSSGSGLHSRRELEAEEEEAPSSGPISKSAPPLAAEFGLQDLIDDEPESRNWSVWLRSYGLWIALAALVIGLGISFAARWLLAPVSSDAGEQRTSQLFSRAARSANQP